MTNICIKRTQGKGEKHGSIHSWNNRRPTVGIVYGVQNIMNIICLCVPKLVENNILHIFKIIQNKYLRYRLIRERRHSVYQFRQ